MSTGFRILFYGFVGYCVSAFLAEALLAPPSTAEAESMQSLDNLLFIYGLIGLMCLVFTVCGVLVFSKKSAKPTNPLKDSGQR